MPTAKHTAIYVFFTLGENLHQFTCLDEITRCIHVFTCKFIFNLKKPSGNEQIVQMAVLCNEQILQFKLAITIILHPQISAMHACPWQQWGVEAVRVYPLRLADVAALKKLLWFPAVALVARTLPSLHNG
jgi:hypothetical protein